MSDHPDPTTTSIPAVLPFAPVTLQDKPTVDRYMTAFGENSCQHSFTALFTLAEKYGSKICEKDGFLFTLREGLCTEDSRVYLAPFGSGDLQGAYDAILADAAAHHCRAVFRTLTEQQADFVMNTYPGRFECTELRDYAEYIYRTEDLCRSAGKKYADKRNKINRLLRTYGEWIEVRRLFPDAVPDALRFEDKWLGEVSPDDDRTALEQEQRAIRLQLENADVLGLDGIAIYFEGEMAAFAYGVALSDDCFDGLIAKATREVPNLYKFLYRMISCFCASPYTWFNWEEDVGIPGIRQAKLEYSLALLMRKYLVQETKL